MRKIPTTSDLTELGASVAEDGFDAHEERVAEIAALARLAGSDLASLDELDDRSAPTVVRARAFGLLASQWDRYHQLLTEQHHRFDESFDRLLAAWNDHQDLRQSSPGVDRLWSSRAALDQLRLETARCLGDLVA